MNPPANWYPDPTGRHGQRYWDGAQWTEHVFTDGVQSVDPLDQIATSRSGDSEAAAEQDAARDGGQQETDDLAPLPRRQRRTPATAAAEASIDEPIAGAEGLFAAVGEEPPAPSGDEPAPEAVGADDAAPVDEAQDDGHDTDTWTPEEAATADEAPVAPEVEPEDVVASVEETAEPAANDFSDAFVLAPETASRLVGRASHPPAEDPPALAPEEAEVPPAAAAPVAEEPPAEEPPAEEAREPDEPPTPAPIDAPPPEMPPPSRSTDLGITGDLVGGAFAEREDQGPVALQNNRMLRCAASGGIVARQGTMVAYQGNVTFERQGAGGVGRALKRAATGEGLAMMRVAGNGDVFFADGGQHVFLLELDGGAGLSVNGRNILAFSSSLSWDIERVKGASLIAGGLFNTTLTGRGWVALVSDGEPVVLRTDDAPTHVDVNALVAWSGGLSTRITNTVSAKSLVGLGSGEAFQMAFDGSGIVIVQPSEGPMGGAAAT